MIRSLISKRELAAFADESADTFSRVIFVSVFAILSFRLRISNVFLSDVLDALADPAFLCILGSRMLFNLKEAGKQGVNEGTSYRSKSVTEVSEMEFIHTEEDRTQSEG